jgi:hypothetical protein
LVNLLRCSNLTVMPGLDPGIQSCRPPRSSTATLDRRIKSGDDKKRGPSTLDAGRAGWIVGDGESPE